MNLGYLFAVVMLLGNVIAHAAEVRTFTVPDGQPGFYAITDSLIRTSIEQQGDLALRVQVRHQPMAGFEKKPAMQQPLPAVYTVLAPGQTFEFDVFLGYLDSGDTVDVVLGENTQSSDIPTPAALDYKILKQAHIPVSVLSEDAGKADLPEAFGRWSNGPKGWVGNDGDFKATDQGLTFDLSAQSPQVLTYHVPQSGTYALHHTGFNTAFSNMISGTVKVGSESKPRYTFNKGGQVPLNMDLGYLAKGETVTFHFKTNAPRFDMTFNASIIQWAVRRAPLRVHRAADGLLDVYEPEDQRKAIDIPASRWITVKAQATDATEVIRLAIMDAAKTQTGENYVGVRLERGKTYTVGSNQVGGNLFEFKEASHLVFDGNGATLVMNSPEIQRQGVNFFSVDRSKKVVLADMTITGDALPYCTGMITDVNPPRGDTQTVTFKLLPGSPDPIKDIARNGHAHGYAYDAQIPGRLAEGAWSFFPGMGDHNLKATDTPGVFTHTITRTASTIKAGSKWLIKNKKAGTLYLVTRGGSEDVTMWKFDCQASGGGLLRNWATDAVNILDTTLKPTGDRTISTTSDGIHGRGREGVWVENLFISGICEDIMNTYARTLAVEADDNPDDNVVSLRLSERSSDGRNRRLVQLSAGDTPQIGDKLLFFNPQSGNVIGYAHVTAIDNGRFTLTNPVPGIDEWEKASEPKATMVYNMQAAARFVVRDSTFADSMRYAVYIKAPHAMIFNNLFEGLSSPPVYAANEPGWPEGPPPSHLWIQGNRFDACNYSYMSRNRAFLNVDPAMISIYTRRFQTKDDPKDYRAFVTHGEYANSHVKIIGNTFENWRGMGISVRNARNVQIHDNQFKAPHMDDVMLKTLAQDKAISNDDKGAYVSIFLDSINGAIIKNNSYTKANDVRQVVADEDVSHVMEK